MSKRRNSTPIKRLQLFFALLIILVGLAIAAFNLMRAGKIKAAWFNDKWGYRKAVNITNGSGSNLTDFQVSIGIGTSALIASGKMQSNCDDIRVTDTNGKLLPYWLSGCNTDTTQVWPKVPSIPTSGSTVYVYYGNPSATSGKTKIGTESFPGLNCRSIIDAGNSTGDGRYWIDPTNGNISDKFQAYCEMTTDGGGWTLIGKGRENWAWNNAGVGTLEDLAQNPSSNSVSYMPAATIDSIIGKDVKDLADGVRVYRYGVNQDWRFSYPTMTDWDWVMDTSKTATVLSRTPSCSGITSGNTYDTSWCGGGNDCHRIFTWGWASHNSIKGWSAGSTCSCTGYGSDGWCYTTEGHVILRTQVFVKEPPSNSSNISPSLSSTEEISKAPIAFWSFDEGQGSTVNDSSSNRNNGTLGAGSSAPTWQTEDMCVSGKCLKFDNSLKYAEVSDNGSLDIGTGDFTISGWIKTQSDTSGSIISKKRQNLIKYSQEFGSWDGYCGGGTLENNTMDTTAPDGTNTAEKLTALNTGGCGDSVSGFLQIDGGLPTGKTYTASIWLKGAAGSEQVSLGLTDGSGTDIYLTTSWVRYSYTKTATTDINRRMQFYVYNANPQPTLYAWGALLEVASEPSQYIRSTSSYLDEGGFEVWTEGTTLKTIIGDTNKSIVSSTSGVTNNEWQHIALVYDRSGNLTYYINGKNVKTDSISGLDGYDLSGASNLFLGNSGIDELYNAFSGFLDEVKTYPYARTAAEIKADYVGGLAGMPKGASALLGGGADSSEVGGFSQGLVGYWKMDEALWNGSANEVIDSSGNSNHGVGVGSTVPTTGAGKFGNGGVFLGTDQYARVTDSTSTDFDKSNGTISIWVKAADFSIPAVQQTFFDTGGSRVVFAVQSDGDLFFYPNLADSGSNYNLVTNPLTENVWNHIVATWNLSRKEVIIYVNGEKKTLAINNVPSYWTTAASTGNFYFGSTGVSPLTGSLDEVRIYNRALSPAEVRQLYEWAPGPLVYYDMNQGVGNTFYNTGSLGTTLNGVLGTGATFPTWGTGKYGKALNFPNGSLGQASGYSSSLEYTGVGGLTMGAWVKRNSNSDTAIIVSKPWTAGGKYNYFFGVNSSGTILLNLDSWSLNVATTETISNNSWHYIAATYDSVTTIYNIYIDGHLSKSGTFTTDWSETNNNAKLAIGCLYPYGTTCSLGSFSGSIDEVKIYNYARTQKQIVEDMNAGHPAVGSPVGSALAHYKFDEGYGITVNNSGNGGTTLNGTFGAGSSAPTWTNDGKFGKALSFDGNDYTELQDNSTLDITTGTWSAWVYPTTFTDHSYHAVIAKAFSTAWWFGLYTTTGRIQLWVAGVAHQSTRSISLNQWSLVTATWDGSSVKFYINGALDNTVIQTGTAQTNNAPAHIGLDYSAGESGAFSYQFTGQLDDVKIYNYALTADEVKTDYNQGKSTVMGSLSSGTGNTAPSTAASQEYCIPGDTATCSPPVGRWDFNEGVGSSAFDTSGSGNMGSWNGTGTHWDKGKLGKAGKFNGSSDYVNMGNPASGILDFGSSTDFTLSVWFKNNGNNDRDTIINKGSGWWYASTHKGYGLGIGSAWDSPNNLTATICDGTNQAHVSSLLDLNDNQWHHTAITADRDGYMKMYVDGKFLNQTSISSIGDISNSHSFLISNFWESNFQRFWHGLIDQVRIYNYARSPAQIAWDYNRGAPVGWWDFDECQGAVAHDRGGLGTVGGVGANSGTINIGATGSQTTVGTCALGVGQSAAWGNGATGKYNASLNFDGTDDYVDMGDLGIPHDSGAITASFWMKSSSIATQGIALNYGNASDGKRILNCHLSETASGKMSCGVFTTSWQHYESNTLTNSIWYYFVLVNDVSNSKFYLYQNGVLLNSGGTTYTGTFTDPNKLRVGNYILGGSYWFNGQIDEVKIWNYALTGQQVKLLHNQGSAIRFGPESGNP